MTTARENVDTRLARGEIGVEEHASIIRALEASTLDKPSSPPPLPVPRAKPANATPWIILGIGASLIMILIITVAMQSDGLSIGNLSENAGQVSFKLGNTSANRGDVLLWVEQGELTMCQHITHVDAAMTYDITLTCPTVQNGLFRMRGKWAGYDPQTAAIAKRIR